MSDDSTNSELHDEKEIDPGEPIGLLAGYQYDPSANFLSRVRRSIHRRTAASQVAAFSWNTPLLVFIEFWRIFIEQFNPHGPGKDPER